jgi:hypothetical protein
MLFWIIVYPGTSFRVVRSRINPSRQLFGFHALVLRLVHCVLRVANIQLHNGGVPPC